MVETNIQITDLYKSIFFFFRFCFVKVFVYSNLEFDPKIHNTGKQNLGTLQFICKAVLRIRDITRRIRILLFPVKGTVSRDRFRKFWLDWQNQA